MSRPGQPAWLLAWRARLWLMLGRQRAALEVFDQMVQCHPEHSLALASRAHLRAQLGDAHGALADYATLTALPSAQAPHFFNQGFLLEAAGQWVQAETSFRRALVLDPSLDRAWFGLALVLKAQARWDEAVAALAHNTRLQPMSPHGWQELARIHAQRGQADEVARIIRHLEGFEPRVAARLRQEMGQRAQEP